MLRVSRERLGNGAEFVFCQTSGAEVVSIQCVVWAGSLDENDDEQGVAHFIEHMLFKGTESRGVGQIAAMVEGAGGDINAYTTFDKTVFYLTLPASEAELGFDVLSDAILRSSFDKAEFEREREVILEEIRRGNDDPGAKIGRAIFAEMFAGTSAARPIIGSSDSVAGFPRATLIGFYERWYQPKNFSIVVTGSLDPETAQDLANKYFGSLEKNHVAPTPKLGAGRHDELKLSPTDAAKVIVIKGSFEQSRLEVVVPSPRQADPDCPAIDAVAYVLGGSEVTRLQKRIKERDGVVNAIGASVFSPAFSGVFEVSAALDPEQFEQAAQAIAKELAAISGAEPPTRQELDRAIAASKIGRIHREETVDGVARALVTGLATTLKDKYEPFYESLLHGVTPHDVTGAMNRWWKLEHSLIVVLCDESVQVDKDEILNSFLRGLEIQSIGAKARPKKTSEQSDRPMTHRFLVGGGVPVIYRHVPGAQMFSITLATEGGLRGEGLSSCGLFHAMATMIGLATKSDPYESFSGRIEDLGAVLGGFSGKDSFGAEMHCTEDQIDEMLRKLSDSIREPQFPDAQWEGYRRETLESLKLQLDSSSWICMRRLHLEVFGDHPYSLPISGTAQSIQALTAQSLQKTFEAWRDSGVWVMGVAGGIPVEAVQSRLTQYFEWFRPNLKPRVFLKPNGLSMEAMSLPLKPKRSQEQAHLALAGMGADWSHSGRAALDILLNVLGGHGGRLFTELRDKESLAYSVSPLHSQGVLGGLSGAYIATAIEKIDKAVESLRRELRLMFTHGPTEAEVRRAKSYILGSHQISLQRTSSQAMTMALMELYGVGWDDFENYPKMIQEVSSADLTNAAKLFLNVDAMKLVNIA